MRLIDADALIDDLKHDVAIDEDSLCYEDLTDINRANIQNDKDIKQNAIDLLNHAPTIEERKTGRWIVMETAYEDTVAKCSECGFETLVNEPGNGLHMVGEMHYYPNCGAKMEGKDGTVN